MRFLGPQECQERYSGLDNLFLSREQVHDQLLAAGCRRVVIEDQCLADYPGGRYRFNAFGWRD